MRNQMNDTRKQIHKIRKWEILQSSVFKQVSIVFVKMTFARLKETIQGPWSSFAIGDPGLDTILDCGCFFFNCGYLNITKFTILTIFKYVVQWHEVFTLLCNHHHHLSSEIFFSSLRTNYISIKYMFGCQQALLKMGSLEYSDMNLERLIR